MSDIEPMAEIVPRVLDRLERLAHSLRLAAAGPARTTVVPRQVLAEHAATADWAARELRGIDGGVPQRAALRASVKQLVLDEAYDLELEAYRCARCGRGERDRQAVHIDHIVPVARGGGNHVDNLQVLCAACNLAKGAA